MNFSQILTCLGVGILGLIIGIGLAVFVACYPKWLEKIWRKDCQEYLDIAPGPAPTERFFSPIACCEQCHYAFKFWEKVPLLNWISTRGRCPQCQNGLAWWPVFLIVLSIIGSVCVYIQYGYSYQALCLAVLTYGLLVLAFIDIREQFLPDVITFGLIWMGLLINASMLHFTAAADAIFGGAAAFVGLWVICWVLSLLKRIPGVAYGDTKMFALMGAWVGLSHVAFPIIIALIVQALCFFISIRLAFSRFMLNLNLQLGSAVALSLWIYLVWLRV